MDALDFFYRFKGGLRSTALEHPNLDTVEDLIRIRGKSGRC